MMGVNNVLPKNKFRRPSFYYCVTFFNLTISRSFYAVNIMVYGDNVNNI